MVECQLPKLDVVGSNPIARFPFIPFDMPIRFRCVFCNQLMGISRRKAGTVVRCPVCASSVKVPSNSDAPPAEAFSGARSKRNDSPPIFERSDFDEILHEPLRPKAAEARPAPVVEIGKDSKGQLAHNAAVSTSSSPVIAGIVLTRRRATVLSVAAVLALALAVLFGYWLGYSAAK